MKLKSTPGYKVIIQWLSAKEYKPFTYQEEAWQHIIDGRSGLVNAPTGTGKTFSVFLGSLIQFINLHPGNYKTKSKNGLQLIWVTPLRALAKDIGRAMEEVIADLGMQWKVGIRNGDTSMAERQKQKRQMPEVLIITPESLHLLLGQKHHPEVFQTLKLFTVDEWHELIGSKRGVQVELALSRIIGCINAKNTPTAIWGISATIGNLSQAMEVLLFPLRLTGKNEENGVIVRAKLSKKIEIESILPDEIEKYPWAGHLGIKLADKVLPILNQSKTTLIFINTRGMSEMWYQTLLHIAPDLAGTIALHHGSIESELRTWVEEALHEGKLKAVVCTASLDLGVDFRPVETVIQVGSPKGVARFLQRAGRSGHSPDAVSKIYFLPTHSLELIEAAALKSAVEEQFIESREPLLLCYDVLVQYLCTLAVSDGFIPDIIWEEVKSTHCFSEITEEEWQEMLYFITVGGNALQQYDEYKKVEVIDGLYKITGRRIAMRHRLHIGTIVSDAMLKVKFLAGGYVGIIEESFISRLEPGDSFTLAGRQLELVMIKDMTVIVKKSNVKKSIVPSWMGGRLPLSASLGKVLREQFDIAGTSLEAPNHKMKVAIEITVLKPLLQLQATLSQVPKAAELLIEQIETRDGFHLFVYPFEGRLVHEAMAAVLAYRISKITPITFSIAMNDYGFELLSDQPIPVDDSNAYELFSLDNLMEDIQRSVNATEMAKRKFRDIAVIGGLIFQGYPGEHKKTRHLQASAGLLFNVFNEYDPNNVLIRQAFQEVFDQQMEEVRLREMLQRIQHSRIIITYPQRLTPFCFPIKVDSMRENLTSEKLADRVKRMQNQLNSL
ncbi:ligase-associated DNA damage response DEXH box helicase [Flavisolibacter ginsengisoli]|jgi:ATP-dependent Lhr-like helicase|uniref:ATP-dependent helicase Lhr and Lhr-like helicase n=1 Tax=Flavisolibacter ginsengisoli DSM 18119 TaxID=1121884 RepID=A0A1M5FBP9_9BACT|nr:ligase-associated DNA damage response DEXH box helicase [Flavisolibacter ginsengisoli]SHF88522.1 ATP-dependent helicase Lhr and Lhr-like helicase [Flavisolibacter ginsengisoli DSM 18119]